MSGVSQPPFTTPVLSGNFFSRQWNLWLQAFWSLLFNSGAAGTDSGTWTPAFVGVTTTGVVKYTASWQSIAGQVFWQCVIDATGGSAALSGAALNNLPFAASTPSTCSAVSITNFSDHGNGFVQNAVARIPDFVVTAGIAVVSGRYAS